MKLIGSNLAAKVMFLFLSVVIMSLTAFAVDPANPPSSMRVTVDKDGQTRTFSLEQYSVRGPNYEVIYIEADGTEVTVVPGPVRTYRGWCEEESDSYVAATLLPNGDLKYHVFKGDTVDWWYQPAACSNESAAAEGNMTDIGGTPVQPAGTAIGTFVNGVGSTDPLYRDTHQVEVGFEGESSYINNFAYSDYNAYVRKIECMVNRFNASTVRDLLCEQKIQKLLLRSNAQIDNYACWDDWNLRWPTLINSNTIDTIGQIYDVGGGWSFVCTYTATDKARINANGWDGDGSAYVVWRHEQGHIYGATDCDGGCPGPEGSTINAGNSLELSRFSSGDVGRVMSCRSGSSWALQNLGIYSYPVPPYPRMDEASIAIGEGVFLDVLANDYDANGNQIAIAGFDTTTLLGGTVEFSAGSGLDGRDELVYFAPENPDKTGEDRFHYTIVDSTGRTSQGNILIYVEKEELKAYWPLNEGTGTVAEDKSGYGRNGAVTNTTFDAASVAGKFGTALRFDGSDDHIDVPGFTMRSNEITLSAWIKADDWSGNRRLLQKGGDASEYRLLTENGKFVFEVGATRLEIAQLPATGRWVHIAAVYDGSTMKVYYDGVEKGSVARAGLVPTSTDTLYIGTKDSGAPAGDRFKGAMDEVRIYNYALDADGIQSHFSFDLTDFAAFAAEWMKSSCGSCGGFDLDSDNNVDFDDFTRFALHWLNDGRVLDAGLLAPGDFIIAVDPDVISNSSYPGAESPAKALDGNSGTKYLNFAGSESGFIVIPGVSSQVQSFRLTTANDAAGRDPASWVLYGSNDAIASGDNSAGLAEHWTLIDSGLLNLPSARQAPGPVVTVNNGETYLSYKLFFPTLKDMGEAMQIADAAFYTSTNGSGSNVLGAGDSILAISIPSNSDYPGGEPPSMVLDGDSGTKHLNFGKEGSGFIVTPLSALQVQSFTITTANDEESRDPASWQLYGTHDAIISGDNGSGTAEDWTLIDSGLLSLPSDRSTVGPVVTATNGVAYTSYKMIFPTVKDATVANSMQIADVAFYTSTNGSGSNVLSAGDPILAVQMAWDSSYAFNERPGNAIDTFTAKYLNGGKENSGFIVTPSVSTVVKSFQIMTANDAEERDPASWQLYGTHEAITSNDNSAGTSESWTLIDSGTLTLPSDRNAPGARVEVDNTTAYSSYKMLFPTVKNASVADSMQIAEIQYYDSP